MYKTYEKNLRTKTLQQLIRSRKKIVQEIDKERENMYDIVLLYSDPFSKFNEHFTKFKILNLILHERLETLIDDILNLNCEQEVTLTLKSSERMFKNVDMQIRIKEGIVERLDKRIYEKQGDNKKPTTLPSINFYSQYKQLHLTDWNPNVHFNFNNNRVLDGTDWEFEIKVDQLSVFRYKGSNSIPYLFYRLEDLFGVDLDIPYVNNSFI